MRQINKRTLDNLIASMHMRDAFFKDAAKTKNDTKWLGLLDVQRELGYEIEKQLSGKDEKSGLLAHHIVGLIEACTILEPIKKMNHKEIYELLKYFDIEVVEEIENENS